MGQYGSSIPSTSSAGSELGGTLSVSCSGLELYTSCLSVMDTVISLEAQPMKNEENAMENII